MRRMIILFMLLGCAGPVSDSDPPESRQRSEDPTQSASPLPDRITGEITLDGGWPSDYRDACLAILTEGGFVELISEQRWTLTRDEETGWFEIRDEFDTVRMREHYLTTVTGRHLDRPGCREGSLFEVSGFEAPPATSATLHVEVVGGIGAAEGSVNVVRIGDDSQNPLLQQPVGNGERMRIPAGSLTILDYQKICDGNCGMAYGTAAPCEIDVDVDPGDELTITVLLGGPQECELLQRPGGPADVVATLQISPFDGALLPYQGVERCVLVGTIVPVLPEGWSIELREPEPDLYEVAFVGPDGRVVARDGDIVWLNGTMTEEQRPFGCDLGTRFDVVEIIQARAAQP